MSHKSTTLIMGIFLFCLQSFYIQAQESAPSAQALKAERVKKAAPRMIYPYLKGSSYFSGVLPVEGITDPADYKDRYKLIFDFWTGNNEDYKQGKFNPGIDEIIRILNLHIASGIPENRMDVTVVVHGPATTSFLNNDAYQKQFGINNPNLEIINQLQNKGVVFTVCGQTLGLRELQMDKLVTGMRKSQSARTAFSTYQLKGYVLFPISED